jgi:hypothetical protein
VTDKLPVIIRIRDRRKPRQYSIENRVLDEWYPIIGHHGYALYSLYVRMASKNDERCYPGYRTISEHLHFGITTVYRYNNLLSWCKLIHIEPGNRRKPNDYYILDVPLVTPQALDSIRRLAQAELKPDSRFLTAILYRLDNWQPIQAIWTRHNKRISRIVRQGQLELALEGVPVEKHPVPVEKHPVPVEKRGVPVETTEQSTRTIHKNNPQQQQGNGDVVDVWTLSDSFTQEQSAAFQELLGLAMTPNKAAELVSLHLPRQIQNAIDKAADEEANNPAGFVIWLLAHEDTLLPIKPYRYDGSQEQPIPEPVDVGAILGVDA